MKSNWLLVIACVLMFPFAFWGVARNIDDAPYATPLAMYNEYETIEVQEVRILDQLILFNKRLEQKASPEQLVQMQKKMGELYASLEELNMHQSRLAEALELQNARQRIFNNSFAGQLESIFRETGLTLMSGIAGLIAFGVHVGVWIISYFKKCS